MRRHIEAGCDSESGKCSDAARDMARGYGSGNKATEIQPGVSVASEAESNLSRLYQINSLAINYSDFSSIQALEVASCTLSLSTES